MSKEFLSTWPIGRCKEVIMGTRKGTMRCEKRSWHGTNHVSERDNFWITWDGDLFMEAINGRKLEWHL